MMNSMLEEPNITRATTSSNMPNDITSDKNDELFEERPQLSVTR